MMKTGDVRGREIAVVNVQTGERVSLAPPTSCLFTSAPFGWRGISVASHRRDAIEMSEHYVVGHGIAVFSGKQPIPFGWKDGSDRWRDKIFNPGEFHMVTDGEVNAPRWHEPFEEISMVLDTGFVADLVRGGLPSGNVEFATQRFASDESIRRYADAFRREILSESPNGSLYAETLAIGLALHLLSTYAVAKPRLPLPRGKLSSTQLRTVVDFVQSHLDENLSIIALADQAHVSPFHFARKFRATIGVTPHQFLLRQRIHRAVCLIRAGKLSLAQIALESGFHDQAHFTRAFFRVLGVTPAMYSGRR
jgi:AraC family transcriptional regulator